MQKYGIKKERKTKSLEDELKETEMCDVCGKNYNFVYIKRIEYFSKNGTHYIIRCCPYCNISNITSNLI